MTFKRAEKSTKGTRNKFLTHLNILIWKAFVQRQQRWRLLALQSAAAVVLFGVATVIAQPVFLKPLQVRPIALMSFERILQALPEDTIVGYQPDTAPYKDIMEIAATYLKNKTMIAAPSALELDSHLYEISKLQAIRKIIWVMWTKKEGNTHKFTIRSSVLGRLKENANVAGTSAHYTSGFLAVQLAVSQALLDTSAPVKPKVQISLKAMPISPLMDKGMVSHVISMILMCYTLALLPPVLETEALIVTETHSRLKRALRLRSVDYSVIYLSWFSYALMTALPVIILGTITMILIFRWVFIATALLTLITYICVMIVMSMIMAMYHEKGWVACIWTTLFTLLQTFLAELLVYHKYDRMGELPTFILNLFLPPLGLVHALDQFALIQTGRHHTSSGSVAGTLLSWWMLIFMYFMVLMLLQRIVKHGRVIGGQQSWRSIIFKTSTTREDKVKPIQPLTGRERANLQPVDELMAKALSFRNVTKNVMGVQLLNNVTFDIYRCEFSLLFAQYSQTDMMNCLEDLITGLTFADSGTIHVLGEELSPDSMHPINTPHMMGYCDQSRVLLDDLTVHDHLHMYLDISLCDAPDEYVVQYSELRLNRLLVECDLLKVKLVKVRQLDYYYRAQLCWALATLLEPNVIVMENYLDHPTFMAVMTDKIIRYKKFITIVKVTYSSVELENADRAFVFDSGSVAFGGTPTYMFFRYGREYRLRLTLESGTAVDNDTVRELLNLAAGAGATVCNHMGSMILLRIPFHPTDKVAEFIKILDQKYHELRVFAVDLSLPDCKEIVQRCLTESRPTEETVSSETTINALNRLSEPRRWKFEKNRIVIFQHLKVIACKYHLFYANFKSMFIINVFAAILSGIMIGVTVAHLLNDMISYRSGKLLTVESMMNATDAMTTLVLRVEESKRALELAQGYVLSEAHTPPMLINRMKYIALPATESLSEYLITKAIDSPENYVYNYAYGMEVTTVNTTFRIRVLYSPMHEDFRSAARSLARVYTALLRYYTNQMDASIQVTDNPVLVENTPWMKSAASPPLIIQLLLVLTVSHVTLVPSNEHGLVRHYQSYTKNFSPARYWFNLLFCDMVHHWMLLIIMTSGMMGMVLLNVPTTYCDPVELLMVPFMLIVYGMAAMPQAYVFSLGSRAALNSMIFAIVNIAFAETPIITKLLVYDDLEEGYFDYMMLSPQYNMAYALVKIQSTFLYNNECWFFKDVPNLCQIEILHMCCEKCGTLQPCFERKSYFYVIRKECYGCLICFVLFMSLLFLWEYRTLQRAWRFMMNSRDNTPTTRPRINSLHLRNLEQANVLVKEKQIRSRNRYPRPHLRTSTQFGRYIIAVNVSFKQNRSYLLYNVSLGLGEGQVLGLAGLQRHGRLKLCELLAGVEMPSEGRLWAMSKYRLVSQPRNYCSNVTLCCNRSPVPNWMTVFEALKMLAILRGVPAKNLIEELHIIIEVLDLTKHKSKVVSQLRPRARKRLHFAAAVVGAPPVIVLDECTVYQADFVRRAMYHIIYFLREHGHSIVISDSNVDAHVAVTNRLAILRDGEIADVDYLDRLVAYYSDRGHTVVLHVKDVIDVEEMSSKYFTQFLINDTNGVLVNMQVLDELSWSEIFEKMEQLKAENSNVYSYVVCSVPIDYIYSSILAKESGMTPSAESICMRWFGMFCRYEPKVSHTEFQADRLKKFENKYDITKLKELPWSVIFDT